MATRTREALGYAEEELAENGDTGIVALAVGATDGRYHALTINEAGMLQSGGSIVGAQGNAWSGASVIEGGVSASINLLGARVVTIFGNSTLPISLEIQASQDDINFYTVDTMEFI